MSRRDVEDDANRRPSSVGEYRLLIHDTAAAAAGDDDDDHHDAAAAAVVLSPTTTTRQENLTVSSPPIIRHVMYNDNDDVYFDEDTTLPSVREEPLLSDEYDENDSRHHHHNHHHDDDGHSHYRRRRRTSHGNSSTTPRPLGCKNYLNVLTYALHLFVSWGIGIWGLGGVLDTRWEITRRYESLVTPAPWSYHLWFPILFLEGLFAAAQCLPYYRNRPIIQDGIGTLFFYTFVLQTAWTLLFSFQCFVASFISVVLALLCLLSLLLSQLHHAPVTAASSAVEYILFRFPFYLHTGWMVLMVVDHFALLFRVFHTTASVQIAMDVLSLAFMLAAGVACLIRPPYQDFVIPVVLIWSFMGIADRLQHPSHAMHDAYGPVITKAVEYAAQCLAGTLTACVVPCVIVWLSRRLCVIHMVQLED